MTLISINSRYIFIVGYPRISAPAVCKNAPSSEKLPGKNAL